MTIGKRLRFEIIKRDGFRCRYCGCSAMREPLEIDHVVPRAGGGTDDPENLITACWSCNRGKSDISLEDSRLPTAIPAEALREQAAQIRGYLSAQQAVEDARADVAEWVADVWRDRVKDDPPMVLYQRFPALVDQTPWERITAAMDAVRNKGMHSATEQTKYFYGCLRRMRQRDEDEAAS